MSSILSTNIGDPTKAIGVDAVPHSLSSNRLPMAIQTSNRHVQIPCSFGNQFSINSGGQQMQFLMNTGAGTGYLKNQTAYLRYKIILNDVNNTNTWHFGGPESDGSSIIQNARLMVGGTQIENINNYQYYHQMLLGHFTSKGYVERTSNLLSASLQDGTSSSTAGGNNMVINIGEGGIAAPALRTNTTYSILIPLALNTLNGTKSLPLFLLGNSKVNLQLDLANITSAITTSSGTFTSLVITDPTIFYEEQRLSNEMEMGIINGMKAEGKAYELPIVTAVNYTQTLPTNQALSFYQSVNLNSALGIVYGSQPTSLLTQPNRKFIQKSYSGLAPTHRFIIDGQQVNNYSVQADSSLFSEFLKVGTTLFNSNTTTRYNTANRNTVSSTDIVSSYATRSFFNGFTLKKYNENNLVNRGTAVQNLNLHIDSVSSLAATYFIYVIHEAMLMVDADGNVMLHR